MDQLNIIKKGGVSFRTEHVLSFSSEKEFVSSNIDNINSSYSKKEVAATLKAIYKEAKQIKKSQSDLV